MELNGVANIQMILELKKMQLQDGTIDVGSVVESIYDIEQQLEFINRYMTAIATMNPDLKKPKWHEVRDNPSAFPTNREKMGR